MVPNPNTQLERTPYPLNDAARIASLEAQLQRETSVPLGMHLKNVADAERRFLDERDRRTTDLAAANDRRLTELAAANNQRLAEGNDLRAQALTIKQIADATALELARQLQSLREAKADEMRDKFGSDQGNRTGRDQIMTWILGSGLVAALVSLLGIYLATGR